MLSIDSNDGRQVNADMVVVKATLFSLSTPCLCRKDHCLRPANVDDEDLVTVVRMSLVGNSRSLELLETRETCSKSKRAKP